MFYFTRLLRRFCLKQASTVSQLEKNQALVVGGLSTFPSG